MGEREEGEGGDGEARPGSVDIWSADILVGGPRAACSPLLKKSPARCRRTAGTDACAPNMKLRLPEMPPATLIAALATYNLLPAIVFLPTRRRCDEAASEAALSRRTVADERRVARREFMLGFAEQH